MNKLITFLLGTALGLTLTGTPLIYTTLKYEDLKQRVGIFQVYSSEGKKSLEKLLFSTKEEEKQRSRLLLTQNGVKNFIQYSSPIENTSAADFTTKIKKIGRFGASRVNGRTHQGLDIPEEIGTNLYSITTGKVIHTGNYHPNINGNNIDYGTTLIVALDDGYALLYAHLKEDSIKVKPGQTVTPTTQLAQVGMTGNVTHSQGPYRYSHLHLEIYLPGWEYKGKQLHGKLINPETIIQLMEGQDQLKLIQTRATRLIY